MTEQATNIPLTERIYALFAYTSAITILIIGGYVISLVAREEIMSAPWQIVLTAMAVPILAVAVASCGNHREKSHIRAATWGIVVPLSVVNPITWLGALVIMARLHVHPAQHPARD